MKKVLSLMLATLLLVGTLFAFTSCGEKQTAKKGMSDSPLAAPTLKADFKVPENFKIGFMFLHDDKSTYDANFMNAAKEIKELLGLSDSQVIFRYPVNEEEECPQAAEYLAEQGCNIIFADSFGHENGMMEIAAKYPNIQFCHATGTQAHTNKNLSNFHNAFASIYEGRYLAGIAAGLKLNEMIKKGDITAEKAVLGYVGAFPYAEVVSGYTAFYLGAKSVCPTATMKVNYTNSWYNVDKERQNALALINDGCVVLSQHADSMGAPSACEEKGVPDITYNVSTFDDCPETFVIGSRINWAPYVLYIIGQVVKGQAIDIDWCGGIDEGSIVLTGVNQDVAAEGTVAAIEEAIKKIKSGEIKVFATNTFTVKGQELTSYKADVDTDAAFTPDTEVIENGAFMESTKRSAPYFDVRIDGITEQ